MKYPKLVKNLGNTFHLPDLKRRVLTKINFEYRFKISENMNMPINMSYF